jgi:hypothetical protein
MMEVPLRCHTFHSSVHQHEVALQYISTRQRRLPGTDHRWGVEHFAAPTKEQCMRAGGQAGCLSRKSSIIAQVVVGAERPVKTPRCPPGAVSSRTSGAFGSSSPT